MPRKKQGLRSYHHKTRNGCLQCKRRRVKCTMQAPACANCVRRNEICEYPTFSESNPPCHSPSQWTEEPSIAGGSVTPALSCSSQAPPTASTVARWPLPLGALDSGIVEASTLPVDMRSMLSMLFSSSWFSPEEESIWVPELCKLSNKYPYLQQCVLALLNLKDDTQASHVTGMPIAAYQHQVTALSLFRQSPPIIDEHNWMAVLAFGTFMLIFQFYTQNACHEDQFDVIETLRVVRSTAAIKNAAQPYMTQTTLWALIISRTTTFPEPDVKMRDAIKSLGNVVMEPSEIEADRNGGQGCADINRHAFWELREWAIQHEGQPRRWEQYCQWPSKVLPEFLDLLAYGNDIAQLIFIHWSAILHRSQKPCVKQWAKRAAFYAIDHLNDEWPDILAWPLEELSPQPRPEASIPRSVSTPIPLSLGSENIDPSLYRLDPTSFDAEYVPCSIGAMGTVLAPNADSTFI